MTLDHRSLIDPELHDLLHRFEHVPHGDLADLRQFVASIGERTDGLRSFEELFIPAPQGHQLRILLYRSPYGGTGPGVLHIHGGGYVAGIPEMGQQWCEVIARECGATVISVDYRLAPETPHPGPVEDCHTALKWLFDHAADLGVDRSRIAIAGESAGGGLTAALAILARDRGEVPVAFQRLIAPMIDDRIGSLPDPHPFAGKVGHTIDRNDGCWAMLLGTQPGGPDVPCYAAAARVPDPAGLPPAFILVGALDLFLEENMEYARRLMRAGVPVELHVLPGAFHGFETDEGARVALAARALDIAAMKRALED